MRLRLEWNRRQHRIGSVAVVLLAVTWYVAVTSSQQHPPPQSPVLSRLTYLGQVMPTDHFSSAAGSLACVTVAATRLVVGFFFLPRCNLWHTLTHRWKHHSDVGARRRINKSKTVKEQGRMSSFFSPRRWTVNGSETFWRQCRQMWRWKGELQWGLRKRAVGNQPVHRIKIPTDRHNNKKMVYCVSFWHSLQIHWIFVPLFL